MAPRHCDLMAIMGHAFDAEPVKGLVALSKPGRAGEQKNVAVARISRI